MKTKMDRSLRHSNLNASKTSESIFRIRDSVANSSGMNPCFRCPNVHYRLITRSWLPRGTQIAYVHMLVEYALGAELGRHAPLGVLVAPYGEYVSRVSNSARPRYFMPPTHHRW